MSYNPSEKSGPADSGLEINESLAARIVERLDRQWAGERSEINRESGSLVGQQLGKYTVEGLIGRGAFGVVYLATDKQRETRVALKVPRSEVLADLERLNRFKREAELASRLKHDGIVPVYEANLDQDTPFIAYAYCSGPDLGKWLSSRSQPIAALDAAMLVAKVADAVHFAHSQGVLHRDLKPGNILLEPSGVDGSNESLNGFRPLLTDFGLARLLQGGLKETRSSLLIGTPNYLAPEQLLKESREYSGTTDIYSLGVILFELVTLRTPFEATTYVEVLDKLRTEQPPRLQSLNPEVPSDFELICRKCLEKDPDDRYQSARDLKEDLERFISGKPLVKESPEWLVDFRRWTRRPERLTQCGTVCFWAQGFAMMWVWAYFALGIQAGALEGHIMRTFLESAVLCIVFSLPLILLGRLLARGSIWAFWPAFSILILQFVGELFGLISDELILNRLYDTVQSKLASYAMLLLGSVFQLGLFAIAIPAWVRNLKHRRTRR